MNNTNRGRLLVVSGPSGIGKGTVCKELLRRCSDLLLSISCTTRPMRPGDEEGVTYFFKTEEEFERMVQAGEFLEYAGMYGKRYGTPRAFVEKNLLEGRDVILEIETQGALQVIQRAKEDVTSVFLLPPSMRELHKRLVERSTETPEKARLRFESAYREIEYAEEYDFVIINDQLEETVEALRAILIASHYGADRALDHMHALKEEQVL